MNHNEKQIRYADYPTPQTGQITPIAPDVFWLRMPLPFALDHINLWLVKDHFNGQNGWTAIDTGVDTTETRQAWQAVIAEQFQSLPILRVLCTHFHPDHMGLAHWLCQGAGFGRWQAPLWINYAEYCAARIWSQPQTDHSTMADYFHRHGIDHPETLEKLRLRKNIYPSLVPQVPHSFRRIFPHEIIRMGSHDWQVIPGYGHSPEHAALYCKDLNVLISGDMLLPKISTNMSVWAQEPDANPLKLYLDSLEFYDQLPDHVLVLPSHGKPFGGPLLKTQANDQLESIVGGGGIKTRLKQLRDHHRDRLEETRQACRQPVSAAQVLPILFRRELDLHQITFALGETIAHLNFLWHAGEVNRHEDRHGVIRFSVI